MRSGAKTPGCLALAYTAYFGLIARRPLGTVMDSVVMPFTETPWKIVNTSYRRGWHG